MSEFALIVGFLLALLIGAVILGTARKMWRGPITQFDAAGWYLQAALSVLATTALTGVALIVKAVVGYIGLQYAYGSVQIFSGSGDSGSSPLTVARTNDLILGLVLVMGGSSLAVLHRWFGRGVPALLQARGAWNTWGIPVITVAYWGLIGLGMLYVTVYGLISNAANAHPEGSVPNVIGDPMGLGLAFTAGWLLLAWVFFGATRPGAMALSSVPPPPPSAPLPGAYPAYPQQPQGLHPAQPPPPGAAPAVHGNPEVRPSVLHGPTTDTDAPAPLAPFTAARPAPPRATPGDAQEWAPPPEPGAPGPGT